MRCIFVFCMNKALLCIGSNDNGEINLLTAKSLIEKEFGEVIYSNTSITTPYGHSYKDDFLNQLAIFYTNRKQEEVIKILKGIEKQLGRSPEDKLLGLVKIDIDLLCWNNEILKPEDMQRKYVTDLLPTITP